MKRLFKRLVSAANSTTHAAANSVEGATFDVLQPDGFFVPYGRYPHKNGIQVFGRAEAEKMTEAFNSLGARVSRLFTGLPVYEGHPDVAGQEQRWPDKGAKGWIKGIEPREDGCFFQAAFNDAGARIIAQKEFAYYSPYWDCERGKGNEIHPVKLKSIGFTNEPLIPVPPLANDIHAGGEEDSSLIPDHSPLPSSNETPMLNKILAALIASGIVKEGDSEDCVIEAIGRLMAGLAEERERKKEMAAYHSQMASALGMASPAENSAPIAPADILAALNEKLAAQAAANDAALIEIETKITAANDSLGIAKSRAISAALDIAISTGRATPADREAKTSELLAIANDADFAAALTGIVTAPVVLKTTMQHTGDIGEQGKKITAANEAAGKSKARDAAVERAKKKFPKLQGSALFEAAWNSARTANPELFA